MRKKATIISFFFFFIISYIFLYFIRVTFSTEVLDNSLNSISKAQDIIVSTAMAYKYRGSSLRYHDGGIIYRYSSQLTNPLDVGSTDYTKYKQWSISRSDCGASPESATSQYIQYASCSPFLLNVYYDAFNGYTIHSINENNEEVPTSNSNHFVFMANPIRDDYYNKNVAVYNLAVINNSGSNSSYTLEEAYMHNLSIVESLTDASGSNTSMTISNDVTSIDDLKEYLRQKLPSILQVGDIIGYTYRYNDGSHVLMYIGKNNNNELQFIHSFIGSTYNYSIKKDVVYDSGAITIWTLDELLDKPGSSYSIFSKRTYMINGESTALSFSSQISIIRPLKEILGNSSYSTVTPKMQARYDHPGLVRTKLASVNKYDSVNPGDLITYTIRLKNNDSMEYNNIDISDFIPDNTTYVGCTKGCILNASSINWINVNIAAGKSEDYSFTVKVNEDTPLRTFIVSNKTLVDNIYLNTIKTEVNKTLTKTMQELLVTTAKEWARLDNVNNNRFSVTRLFIQELYDSLGVEWFNFKDTTSSDILLNYFYTKQINGAVEVVKINNTATLTYHDVFLFNRLNNVSYENRNQYQKILVDGLYGGYYAVDDEPIPRNDINNIRCFNKVARSKVFDNSTLMIGDVVVLYDKDYESSTGKDAAADDIQISGAYNMYLYLGNGEFATVPEYDPKVTIFSNKVNNTNRSRFLDSLLGQTVFVVLRPSYAITSKLYSLTGDVNYDGVIDAEDARILAKYIIDNNSVYGVDQLLNGDMDGNGEIKINDVTIIINEYNS